MTFDYTQYTLYDFPTHERSLGLERPDSLYDRALIHDEAVAPSAYACNTACWD